MNKKFLLFLFINLLFVSLICYSQQKEKIKFGLRYSVKSHQFIFLDDVPNHKMGLASGTGIAYLKDAATANVDVYFVYDYVSGSGSFIENYVIHMSDSSKITIKAVGNSYGDEYFPMFTGDVTIMNGTGSYKGIRGKGKMNGDRKSALDDSAVVNLNFDLEYYYEN